MAVNKLLVHKITEAEWGALTAPYAFDSVYFCKQADGSLVIRVTSLDGTLASTVAGSKDNWGHMRVGTATDLNDPEYLEPGLYNVKSTFANMPTSVTSANSCLEVVAWGGGDGDHDHSDQFVIQTVRDWDRTDTYAEVRYFFHTTSTWGSWNIGSANPKDSIKENQLTPTVRSKLNANAAIIASASAAGVKPSAAEGVDGNFAINVDGSIWGPKAAGAWPAEPLLENKAWHGEMKSGVDLKTVTKPGTYDCLGSCPDSPMPGQRGVMTVYASYDADHDHSNAVCKQVWYNRDGTEAYSRSVYNGVVNGPDWGLMTFKFPNHAVPVPSGDCNLAIEDTVYQYDNTSANRPPATGAEYGYIETMIYADADHDHSNAEVLQRSTQFQGKGQFWRVKAVDNTWGAWTSGAPGTETGGLAAMIPTGTAAGSPPAAATGVDDQFAIGPDGNIYGPKAAGAWPATPVGGSAADKHHISTTDPAASDGNDGDIWFRHA